MNCILMLTKMIDNVHLTISKGVRDCTTIFNKRASRSKKRKKFSFVRHTFWNTLKVIFGFLWFRFQYVFSQGGIRFFCQFVI